MDAITKIENLLVEGSLWEAKKLLDGVLGDNAEEPPLYLHYLIAIYHIKSLDYDLAIPHLLKVDRAETYPHYLPKVYKLLGYCSIMKKDYEQGESILKEFMQNYYSDVDTQNMLAFSSYAQGKVEEALLQYRDILAIDPENLTTRNGLAYILVEYKNNPKEALEILEPWGSRSIDPKVLDTLGWIYFRMGEIQKAEPYLRRAFDLMPAHPEVNRHMSLLMAEL